IFRRYQMAEHEQLAAVRIGFSAHLGRVALRDLALRDAIERVKCVEARFERVELRMLRSPQQLPVGAAKCERRDGEEKQLLAARVLRKQCHVISPTARGERGATASNPDGCSSS